MRTFGEEMRTRLQQLHVGIRKVDDFSRRDANTRHSGALHISRYRLHQLQQNASDITVAEIAELARLCQTSFKEVLSQYLRYYPNLIDGTELPSSTELLSEEACDWLGSLTPAGNETGLIEKSRAHFNFGGTSPTTTAGTHHIYGRIGLNDLTMWPLLQPGSIIRVNTRQKVVARHGSWHNDYDRPIYFLEIRNGFACGWCDLCDRQLILTPHSLSPASPRTFILGREVEIRGRVVGYAVDCECMSEIQVNSGNGSALSRHEAELPRSIRLAKGNDETIDKGREVKMPAPPDKPSVDVRLRESA